ncbi:MAG: DUF3667 domain-containing protein [Cyclobacteriaceae bacterium]|nr:DUF3667 domain-containing protein [Cyclobacteriaceae bacterium]
MESTCINCGTVTSGTYCANCGQRVTVKRLSFREGWNDFWARIYGFDGMLPRTLRDLTIRPGKAAVKFIERNRVQYYGPVGYFFLMITLLYVVASLLGIDMVDFLKNAADTGLQKPPKAGSGQEKFMQETVRVVSDNMKVVSFIIVPIQAFCSRYIFFRKSNWNFIEHMVLPFYALGHLYWFSIASLIAFWLSGSFIPNWAQMILGIGYFSFAYANMFTYQNRVKAFLKGFGVYLVSQLALGLLIAIAIVVLLILNPEVFELLKPSNNL